MPTPINDVQQKLSRILIWGADLIAKDARSLAKTSRIRRSIKVDPVQTLSDTSQSITIKISTQDAPEALAYEFGSGIWGKEGKKYPINPVNAKMLAFDWPEAANIGAREGVADVVTPVTMNAKGGFTGGRAILPGVMHPGVKAVPYMKPALDKNKNEIVSKAADASVKAIADMTVITKVVVIK